MRVTLESAAGNWISLTESGEYLVDITPGVESVTNYGGSAVLVSEDGSVSQVVTDAQRGLFYPDSAQMYVMPAPDSLIAAPTFTPDDVIASSGSPAQLMQPVWRCYSVANEDPVGAYSFDALDGRQGLALNRGGGARSHGETLCSYSPNAGQGVDVTGYDWLSLDLMFNVLNHSLSACGSAGTECPITVRVDYIPEGGSQAMSWFHGFFATFDPTLPNPLICPSCTQEHDAVNAGAWYNYQSDNLFSLIPADQRPASILNVVLYASGHEYGVFLENAELFAGYTDPQPPVNPELTPIATNTP